MLGPLASPLLPRRHRAAYRDYYRRGEAKESCFIAALGATPRIPPGDASDIGCLNALVARAAGAVTGGDPPNVFTTLARHRRLFRRWLWFAGALMPGGVLPRAETELLILRVAHNCGCEYEWHQHERLGVAAGLGHEDVERVRQGPGASGWGQGPELL